VGQYFKSDDGPVVIVYCRPTTTCIQRNAAREEQMKGVSENLLHVIEAYDQLMIELDLAGLTVKHFNWSAGYHYEFIDQLNLLLEGKTDGPTTGDLHAPEKPDGQVPQD